MKKRRQSKSTTKGREGSKPKQLLVLCTTKVDVDAIGSTGSITRLGTLGIRGYSFNDATLVEEMRALIQDEWPKFLSTQPEYDAEFLAYLHSKFADTMWPTPGNYHVMVGSY